jgi:uncharacterized protein
MSSYIYPFLGGSLIGLSATLLLFLHGRVAGISGIVGSVLASDTYTEERKWRVYFLVGLVGAGALLAWAFPHSFAGSPGNSLVRIGVAGLLVGYGTRLGSGCTSGHGVCGISRLSVRSLAATGTFILFGAITVFVVKQLGGYQ